MIEMTENDLLQSGARGECLEVVFNQFYLLSVWRWESPAGGFWSLELVKYGEAVGLLAEMDDGLYTTPESIGPVQYTRDWSEVMACVGELATKHSEPKRC